MQYYPFWESKISILVKFGWSKSPDLLFQKALFTFGWLYLPPRFCHVVAEIRITICKSMFIHFLFLLFCRSNCRLVNWLGTFNISSRLTSSFNHFFNNVLTSETIVRKNDSRTIFLQECPTNSRSCRVWSSIYPFLLLDLQEAIRENEKGPDILLKICPGSTCVNVKVSET